MDPNVVTRLDLKIRNRQTLILKVMVRPRLPTEIKTMRRTANQEVLSRLDKDAGVVQDGDFLVINPLILSLM